MPLRLHANLLFVSNLSWVHVSSLPSLRGSFLTFFLPHPLGLGCFPACSLLVEGSLGYSHWWEILSHPSESSSQKPAVPLTPSDLLFPSLSVAWLFLRRGSHHNHLPMCCCDLNSGSRKKLTILRLVAHCAEPPHQLKSSSLLHPDAQTVCLPTICFVLHETLSQKRISVGTARSSFRETHQEGGSLCTYGTSTFMRWAWFWKLSFYSEVIKSTEGVKQRKRGRFAKWPQTINQSSTNPCPLHSLTSRTLNFCFWRATVQLLSLWLLSSGQFPFLLGWYESSPAAPVLQSTLPPTYASFCASHFSKEGLVLPKPSCLVLSVVILAAQLKI